MQYRDVWTQAAPGREGCLSRYGHVPLQHEFTRLAWSTACRFWADQIQQ
jgi:hypothetical protein